MRYTVGLSRRLSRPPRRDCAERPPVGRTPPPIQAMAPPPRRGASPGRQAGGRANVRPQTGCGCSRRSRAVGFVRRKSITGTCARNEVSPCCADFRAIDTCACITGRSTSVSSVDSAGVPCRLRMARQREFRSDLLELRAFDARHRFLIRERHHLRSALRARRGVQALPLVGAH